MQVVKLRKPKFTDTVNYLIISDLIDSADQDAARYFEDVTQFIGDALASGGAVLVHCSKGVSRSPTMVIAYLITREKMRYKDALARLRQKRYVLPNEGFSEQLFRLEEQVFGDSQRDFCYTYVKEPFL